MVYLLYREEDEIVQFCIILFCIFNAKKKKQRVSSATGRKLRKRTNRINPSCTENYLWNTYGKCIRYLWKVYSISIKRKRKRRGEEKTKKNVFEKELRRAPVESEKIPHGIGNKP